MTFKQRYIPWTRTTWIDRYGRDQLAQEGYDVVPCSPSLGCTDGICHGWRVKRPEIGTKAADTIAAAMHQIYKEGKTC